jgi:nucleoid-associated protein YgaU
VEPATSQPQSSDPAILKSTEAGVSLVLPRLAEPNRIALDTIGYSDSGVVQLSGRASAEAREIRVYLDNRFVARLPLDASGSWRGDVPDVDTGVYTLRIDAVDATGRVTSRVETPFRREAPAVLAAASTQETGAVRAVTVQAGDTLWAIARERYGEGVLYVRVFEANRASIRDPDLIFPGQVFDLPGE